MVLAIHFKIADREIHAIYPDDNGITWLGSPDGSFVMTPILKRFSIPFYAHIRKIKLKKILFYLVALFIKQ